MICKTPPPFRSLPKKILIDLSGEADQIRKFLGERVVLKNPSEIAYLSEDKI